MALSKQLVSGEMINSAIAEFPEYFPDEVGHRRKWSLIPENVHTEYWDERERLHSEIFKDMPPSKGILGWIEDRSGYKEWNEAYQKCRLIELPLAEKLHKKYYEQYGIEFSGW